MAQGFAHYTDEELVQFVGQNLSDLHPAIGTLVERFRTSDYAKPRAPITRTENHLEKLLGPWVSAFEQIEDKIGLKVEVLGEKDGFFMEVSSGQMVAVKSLYKRIKTS